ncbi:FG-GAP-like repeat-containing protein [Neorhodopirellula pilleata]|uniref:FG-GAP-like repeat-containing protein n=1 Tax=Neorhodopirellula pilleata TaxID=2714738 RepID=UPI001E5885C9|nr:FG-GAP-like repeat-containing protein [Neorhodopirellula pilleata]
MWAIPGCGSNESSKFEEFRKRQKQRELDQVGQPQDLTTALNKANHELKYGAPSRVLAITEPLLLVHPEDPELIVLTAKALAATGSQADAANLIASIPADEPRFGNLSITESSKWFFEAGQVDEAIERLTNHLHDHPDDNRVRRQAIRTLNRCGRQLEASEHLTALLRRGEIQEKELFSMLNLNDLLLDETTEPEKKSDRPENGPEANGPEALYESKRLREVGQYEEAIHFCRILRNRFPDSTPIAAFLGRLLAERNRFEELADWAEGLPSEIQREPEYWYAMGTLAAHQGQDPVAVRCFAEAINRNPTDRHSTIGLARALIRCGQGDQASCIETRFQHLDEIANLALALGRRAGTTDQYHRLADHLDQLDRPLEAFAWKRIAMSKSGATAEDYQANDQARSESGSASATGRTRAADRCHIELSRWPLPSGNLGQVLPTEKETPASLPSSQHAELNDIAAVVGLDFEYQSGDDWSDDLFYLHQQTGGGIGVIDFDQDGWPDLYFTQSGGRPNAESESGPNRLFRNLNGEQFQDISDFTGTADRGYGQGVSVADFNQDGWMDIWIANIGRNVLRINNGDGTFQDQALPIANDNHWTTSVAAGDLDGNGLPEIIEVNYIDDPRAFQIACTPAETCGPNQFHPGPDRWLTVTPNGGIERWRAGPNSNSPSSIGQQVVAAVGRSAREGHGFAAIIADIDGAGGNDVYVANDGDTNFFWNRQTEPGHAASLSNDWSDSADLAGCAGSARGGRHGSMGLAAGDFDRNGMMDLFVTNYWDQEADLYLQQTRSLFRHATETSDLTESSKPTVGWGTQAIDINRDGWLDMIVLNGHIVDHTARGIPFKMLPQLYLGSADRFHLAHHPVERETFWSEPTLGRTLATLDWNRDGRPDFVANRLDGPAALLQNNTDVQNWLRLKLVGVESERDAVGAKVIVDAGEHQWTGWVVGGGGFLCSNEAILDFGLADQMQVDRLEIIWPSGTRQTLDEVEVNRTHLIVETQSDSRR